SRATNTASTALPHWRAARAGRCGNPGPIRNRCFPCTRWRQTEAAVTRRPAGACARDPNLGFVKPGLVESGLIGQALAPDLLRTGRGLRDGTILGAMDI